MRFKDGTKTREYKQATARLEKLNATREQEQRELFALLAFYLRYNIAHGSKKDSKHLKAKLALTEKYLKELI